MTLTIQDSRYVMNPKIAEPIILYFKDLGDLREAFEIWGLN